MVWIVSGKRVMRRKGLGIYKVRGRRIRNVRRRSGRRLQVLWRGHQGEAAEKKMPDEDEKIQIPGVRGEKRKDRTDGRSDASRSTRLGRPPGHGTCRSIYLPLSASISRVAMTSAAIIGPAAKTAAANSASGCDECPGHTGNMHWLAGPSPTAQRRYEAMWGFGFGSLHLLSFRRLFPRTPTCMQRILGGRSRTRLHPSLSSGLDGEHIW